MAGILIQSSTLRPLTSALGVLKMYESVFLSSDGQSHQETALLGKLAPMCPHIKCKCYV